MNVLDSFKLDGKVAVVSGGAGLYGFQIVAALAEAGATVPLTGFGYSLATGVKTAVDEFGFIGALSGGLTATASGITASVLFGLIMAILFKPGDKT